MRVRVRVSVSVRVRVRVRVRVSVMVMVREPRGIKTAATPSEGPQTAVVSVLVPA